MRSKPTKLNKPTTLDEIAQRLSNITKNIKWSNEDAQEELQSNEAMETVAKLFKRTTSDEEKKKLADVFRVDKASQDKHSSWDEKGQLSVARAIKMQKQENDRQKSLQGRWDGKIAKDLEEIK